MNKKYVAPLLVGVSMYAHYNAQGEVVDPSTQASANNPVKVESKVVEVTKEEACCDLRDKSKDKPFEFGMSIGFSAFYDVHRYGAQQKFGANRLKAEHARNPKRIDAFSEFALSASKEINIFSDSLIFNATVEKEIGESKLTLSKLFIEIKSSGGHGFVLGNNAGTFCSYVPASDRYTAFQFALNHKIDDNFSYTLAIEELQGATVRPKKEEEEVKKEQVPARTSDGSITNVDTTTDKKEELLRTSNEWPKLALAANFMYKDVWGNVQFSALGAPLRYYYNTGEDVVGGVTYKTAIMYGGALSGKYIISSNADYLDGEEATISSHVKYRDGLGGYHGEAGGLPEDVNANFCLSADGTKVEANLRTIGFGLSSKYSWNQYVSSSVSSSVLLVLNKSKMAPSKEGVYNNGLTMKVAPTTINITKNFVLEPSYTFGMGNVIGNGKSKTIQRVGLSISYDI